MWMLGALVVGWASWDWEEAGEAGLLKEGGR